MDCVNWNDPHHYTRTVKGKPKTELRFPVMCSCGAVRLLKRCDAQKAEKGGGLCSTCSAREKSVKGYAATRAKYGENFSARIVRDYRLDHPSSLERQIMAHLESLHLSYQREMILCDRWLVDFLVDGHFVIEVDGDYAHSRHDPYRDAYRRNQIEDAGYSFLNIREADVPQSRSLIAFFMEVSHVRSAVYA